MDRGLVINRREWPCPSVLVMGAALALMPLRAQDRPTDGDAVDLLASVLRADGQPVYTEGGMPKPALASRVLGILRDAPDIPRRKAYEALLAVGEWGAAIRIAPAMGVEEHSDDWVLSVAALPVSAHVFAGVEFPDSPRFSKQIYHRLWAKLRTDLAESISAVQLRGRDRTPLPWLERVAPPNDLDLLIFLDSSDRRIEAIARAASGLMNGTRSRVRARWIVSVGGSLLQPGPIGSSELQLERADSDHQQRCTQVRLLARSLGLDGSVHMTGVKSIEKHWQVRRLPAFVVTAGDVELDRAVGWGRDTLVRLRCLLRGDTSASRLEWAEQVHPYIVTSPAASKAAGR